MNDKLFGKYDVCNINKFDNQASLWVGKEDNVLAVAYLVMAEDEVNFRADFAVNNPEAKVKEFKQLYEDAKNHFKSVGVSPHQLRKYFVFSGLQKHSQEDDPIFQLTDFKAAKAATRTGTLASFLTYSSFLGYFTNKQLAREQQEKLLSDIYIQVEEFLRAQYPILVEEEVVPYGTLGAISGNSKISTLEKGLYIVMEGPARHSGDLMWPINLQVNSDETHEVEKVTSLRKDIMKLILNSFDGQVKLLEDPNQECYPRHHFGIDLQDLVKGKQLLDSPNLEQFLLR